MKNILAANQGGGGGNNTITNPALGNTLEGILSNDGGAGFFPALITSLVSLFLILGIIFAFFYMIFGGINYILSGGDKTKTENARHQITYALIGLVVLFSVFAIVSLIETIFDVSILQIDITQFFIS